MRPLLARAARLIATADWEVDYYLRDCSGCPPIASPSYPTAATCPRSPSLRLGKDGTLIVSVGHLERYKGHHRVLASTSGVIDEVPDARLLGGR